jgi:hypothetical protein
MKSGRFFAAILIVSALLILLIQLSCTNPTEPPSELEPGRRDYIWTVDTIQTSNNDLYALWGSSPTDLWLGGAGGITNHDNLWHFSGDKWRPFSQYVAVFPNTIFGFAQDDVWIGGGDGLIYHFDGIRWSEAFVYKPVGYYNVHIADIYGLSPDDVYAVGVIFYDQQETQRGFILHYDGSKWKEIYQSTSFSQFQRIRVEKDQIFILGIRVDYINSDHVIVFYEYKDNELIEIFSEHISFIKGGGISMIGAEVYFVINRELNRYINGEFVKVMSFNEPNFGYQLYGRNMKDIFISMKDGLAHYDGRDFEYLYKYKNNLTSIRNVPQTFEKEIFFSIRDFINNVHFVLHGKLKE